MLDYVYAIYMLQFEMIIPSEDSMSESRHRMKLQVVPPMVSGAEKSIYVSRDLGGDFIGLY